MLYYIANYLTPHWGPFRLLQSHLLLMAGGTIVAAIACLVFLPRFWDRLPRDHGKTILGADGMVSKGKPTGAGLVVTLIALPAIILFAPMQPWDAAAVASMYLAMLFGYLDDRSSIPWGELKKGLLDAVVCIAVAVSVYMGHSSGGAMHVWLPFTSAVIDVAPWVYIPCAAFMLWFTMNATNCSDGIDGLAGTLTVMALAMLSILLYVVIGHHDIAKYFLVPFNPSAAGWAIASMVVAGAFGGYLWYNANPSQVLMGDAGSRFLGVLLATAILVAGNPFLLLALAPVVIVNGGGGLAKLTLLRLAKKLGREIDADSPIRKVRFPLHDHCRKNLGWSPGQILMRFMLLQIVIMPFLLIFFLKIR